MTRSEALERLLAQTGFAGAERTPLAADASTRRYERLKLGDRHAMLMDAPPVAESAPCPPGAKMDVTSSETPFHCTADGKLNCPPSETLSFVSNWCVRRSRYLSPVGNPAPPRPGRVAATTSARSSHLARRAVRSSATHIPFLHMVAGLKLRLNENRVIWESPALAGDGPCGVPRSAPGCPAPGG